MKRPAPKKKILVVARPESTGISRWLGAAKNDDYEFHFVPWWGGKQTDAGRLHRRMIAEEQVYENVLHHPGPMTNKPGAHERFLAELIKKLKPDLIHSVQIPTAGFMTMKALDILSEARLAKPRWMISSLGSDISFYGLFKDLAPGMKRIVSAADFFVCECDREITLVKNMGFKGTALGALPTGGGANYAELSNRARLRPPSSRSEILIKGYQNHMGRALVALRAVERCAKLLKNYKIKIFGAGHQVHAASNLIAARTGIDIEILGQVPHQKHLERCLNARVSIGLSMGDGVPAAVLEAMAAGAFPVQSDTSCSGDWFVDGQTGFLVPPEDPAAVARALSRALRSDELVDQAALKNAERLRQKLNARDFEKQVAQIYEKALT